MKKPANNYEATFPKLLFSFPNDEPVLDMYVYRKRQHWYSLRKKAILYIATSKGVYTIT